MRETSYRIIHIQTQTYNFTYYHSIMTKIKIIMAQEKTFTYLTVWYLFPECINSYSLYRM